MAHLWVADTGNEWVARLLSGDAVPLADGVVLQRAADPPNTWAVMTTQPRLRLNGLPVPLGLAVLEDRDEIRVPGVTAWYSTELRAQVEPFPESTARGFCPRCKQAIATASHAVVCPQCGVWHHQSAELPCWLYAPTCALCPQPTELESGFRWTPGEL
jgi:hypothetical protein